MDTGETTGSSKCVLCLIAHTCQSSKWVLCPITNRWCTCRRLVQRPLIRMAGSSVSLCMDQRMVLKFFVNEGVKLA